MPSKLDMEQTTGRKLLRLYREMTLNGKQHYLIDLAEQLNCSKQTIARLIREIEGVIGSKLLTGMERHKRWYKIESDPPAWPVLCDEEMRHLRICCDLAEPFLPAGIKDKIAGSLRLLAMLKCDTLHQASIAAQEGAPTDDGKYMDYSDCHETLAILLGAIKNGIICELCYQPSDNHMRRHMLFAPARLVAMNNSLQIMGAELEKNFSDLRGIIRLSVRGITNIEATSKKYKFHVAPDL